MKRTITRGTAAAESRYVKLRQKLDQDLYNANWVEVETDSVKPPSASMGFVDLFSGAGGLSLGLAQAGFRKLLSNEIDRDASATIRRNFPDSLHLECPIEQVRIGAALDLKPGELPLLAGGPPCNGFSVAGYRRPGDARNKLGDYFINAVEELHPWFVVMENVPGIFTLSKGKFAQSFIERLTQLGYSVSYRILEAAEFGVPQLRTRAIFVANRFGEPNPYPKPLFGKEAYKSIDEAISDLEGQEANPSINHEWTRHSIETERRIARVKPGESLYASYRDAFKRQFIGAPSMAIKENHGGTHIHPRLNRVISAREMARLQTFPDSYIFDGTMKRAMWQVGNAVPPLMAQNIGLALIPTLSQLNQNAV